MARPTFFSALVSCRALRWHKTITYTNAPAMGVSITNMKIIISALLIFLMNQAFASWSGFAAVTPESKSKYNIDLKTTISPKSENCTVTMQALAYPSKHAWLILTSKQLSEKEQELREFIWNGSLEPSSLVKKIKLSPGGADKNGEENIKNLYYEFTISEVESKGAYVYIDFPDLVFDGGYYYSIDVGAFCTQARQYANKPLNATPKSGAP